MRKQLIVVLLCSIMLLTLVTPVVAVEYSSTGYRTGNTGTIYLQNNLDNASIYSNHFVTAVAYWNNAGVAGRSFTVNTVSSSQIYNEDFSTSSWTWLVGLHNDGVLATTYKWGQTTAYCTCHTTYAFDIICNDARLVGKSTNYKRAVIVHELGHTLGLIDYKNSNQNISIMSYLTDFDVYYTPFSFDVTNASDCWAPHYNG